MENEIEHEGLTPEEIAALKDDDDTAPGDDTGALDDDQVMTAKEIAALKAAPDEPPAEKTVATEQTAEEKAAAEAKAEAEAAADDNDDDTPDGKPAAEQTEEEKAAAQAEVDAAAAEAEQKKQAPIAPLVEVKDTAEIKTKLEALDAKRDALDEQFEEGDMTTAEYRKQNRALDNEALDLRMELNNAHQAERINQGQIQQMWANECTSFLNAHPEVAENQLLFKAFDACVIDNNQQEHQNIPMATRLDNAYKQWCKDLGREPAGKPAQAPAKKDTPAPAKKKDVPPSLGGLPSAESTPISDDDGTFGRLDRLFETNPVAAEKELAKLSEEAQNRYLAS